MAEVSGIGEGFSAGTVLRVELGVSPSAASPGNWSTVDAVNMWEWVSWDDGSSWPSFKVDSSGGGDESEEFHF